jgi:hypothetical protein
MLRGFINLVPTGGTALATLATDMAVMIMALACVSAMIRGNWGIAPWLTVGIAVLLGVNLLLFPWSPEPLSQRFISLRNSVLYAVVAIYITTFANARAASLALRAVRWLGVFIAAFGIVQFALRGVLPRWLLEPTDAAIFTYWGTDIVRANGLVGNTIVYSAVLLLVFSVWICRAAAIDAWRSGSEKWVACAASVIVGAAIVLTFSRMAIVLAAFIAVASVPIIAARHGRKRLLTVLAWELGLSTVVAVGVLATPALRDRVFSSFVFQDLFGGGNATVAASTDLHAQFVGIALDALHRSPWLGLGLATQSQTSLWAQSNPVITDGAILSTLAEGGIILLLATFALYGLGIVLALRGWLRSDPGPDPSAALACAAYVVSQFFIASTLNSGFFGKTPFVVFWVCFACALVVCVSPATTPTVDPDEPRRRTQLAGPGLT